MSRETTIETFGMISSYNEHDGEVGAPMKPLTMKKYSSTNVMKATPLLTDNVYN